MMAVSRIRLCSVCGRSPLLRGEKTCGDCIVAIERRADGLERFGYSRRQAEYLARAERCAGKVVNT